MEFEIGLIRMTDEHNEMPYIGEFVGE